ncbi:MAG: OmpH family outer membrane protein, partial [Sphingobium sp.]
MKMIFKAIALASAPATVLAMAATPASAQSKQGIAVVDQQEALNKTAAFTTAVSQMQVTYKATLDSVQTRQTALQAEL